jgi:hypothetical protein
MIEAGWTALQIRGEGRWKRRKKEEVDGVDDDRPCLGRKKKTKAT